VYSAVVDLSGPAGGETELALVGRSSSDGRSGAVDRDLSGLSTALEIVDEVRVRRVSR
jgi:hypothetical protein